MSVCVCVCVCTRSLYVYTPVYIYKLLWATSLTSCTCVVQLCLKLPVVNQLHTRHSFPGANEWFVSMSAVHDVMFCSMHVATDFSCQKPTRDILFVLQY